MANHALPTTASTYTNFVTELRGRIDDAVKDNTTLAAAAINLENPPTNMVRWNDTNKYWEINTGTPAAPTWNPRSTRYDININGTVGATTPNTGAFTTLSTSGVASLGTNSTVGGVLITTASNTQTLTNKTLTSPIVSTIVNTGTLTLPTSTDTLVGRATTDTLTNKTLTLPRFSSGTSLADVNGVSIIAFPTTVTSAVNFISVNNSISAVAPSIVAKGTDTNVSLNLAGQGTGTVTVNNIPVVTTSDTQTLTNKTLTLPVISTISNSGTVTIPAGTDTLVNLSSSQSLSNKTFTSSAFNGTVGATTASTGAFTTLTASTSLNVTGTATATTFSGAGTSLTGTASALNIGGTAAVGTTTTITDDASTATTVYPTWVTGSSGNLGQRTTSTRLTFTPSTGVLSATSFSGAGTGLTGTASSLNIGGNAATATTAGACSGNSTTATTATYLSSTQQTAIITGKQQSMNMGGSTADGSFVCKATGTGDANMAGTIFWNDAYAIKLGIRADGYFGLGGWSRSTWSWYSDPSGNMVAAGNVTAYSDPKLKQDFARVQDPLAIIAALDGGTFTWKHGYKHTEVKAGKRDYGILADQVQSVMPEIVCESINIDGESYKTVSYEKLVPVLIEAIKVLQCKIAVLEDKL